MTLLALFPGLPTVQFSIACSMQKRRGIFYYVNDVSVYLGGHDRGQGYPIERMSLRPYLVVSAPNTGVLNVREVKNILLQIRNEEYVHKMQWGTPPPLCLSS